MLVELQKIAYDLFFVGVVVVVISALTIGCYIALAQ